MALDDRIRTSVDHALQGLVSELLTISSDETAQQLQETEGRLHDEFEQRLASLQDAHREEIARQVREAVQSETARVAAEAEQRFDQRLSDALAAATASQVAETANQLDAQARAFDERLRAAVIEAEARAASATEASIAAARAGEREFEMAGMARLVESVRGLDGATSLSEVLDALALAAARETVRAAVVVVKGDRVVGWRLSGFGGRDAHPKGVDLSLAESGVIGLAATSSRAVTTRDGDADGPGFEHLPADRMGLAMPVVVGGRVVAVLYADTGDRHDQVVPSAWPEVVEVLARHAGRCLEALTAQKAGLSPSGAARRVASAHVPGAPVAPGALG